jgi:putative hydrolase of the HAD superfamily
MNPRPFEPVPAAVFFDLDDTLCDYAGARETRLRVAFALGSGGQIADGPILDRMIEDSIRMHPHGADHFGDLFRRYGIDDPRSASRASDWYTANRFHGLRLFPDVAEVLSSVRSAPGNPGAEPRPIGIITNGPTDVQRAKAELLEILDLADFVLISEEFGAAKPVPEIFHEALRRAGVDASDAVFVGDSPDFDIAGAHAAGVRSVWLNRRGEAWNAIHERPSREIRSLLELPALVGSG